MNNRIHPRLGALKDTADPRDYRLATFVAPTPVLPSIVDYEGLMSPVRDQTQRGACVAFASIAVKEYQERKQAGFKAALDLSEEWVYEQVRQPGGGAQPRDAFTLFDKAGVCHESYMRYKKTITDDSQEPPFKPGKKAIADAPNFKAQTYARLRTIAEMQQSLYLNGPFLIGVSWLNNWFQPQGSGFNGYPVIAPDKSYVAGGHALCIVGYDDKQRLFKFRNSWGTSWGKQGYAYFSYTAIAKNLMDAWASVDLGGTVQP